MNQDRCQHCGSYRTTCDPCGGIWCMDCGKFCYHPAHKFCDCQQCAICGESSYAFLIKLENGEHQMEPMPICLDCGIGMDQLIDLCKDIEVTSE